MPQILVARNRPTVASGLTGEVFLHNESLLTQLGSIGASTEEPGGANDGQRIKNMQNNRVIQVRDKLFALLGKTIYESDDEGATWSTALALTAVREAGSACTGIWPVAVDNNTFLAGFYATTTNSEFRWFKYDIAADTWSQAASGTVIAGTDADFNDASISSTISYKNKLYAVVGDAATETLTFDPQSESIGFITNFPGANSNTAATLCEYAGHLYYGIFGDVGGSVGRLLRLSGGAWVEEANLGGSYRGAWSDGPGRAAFFVADDDNMYWIGFWNGDNAYRCYKFTHTSGGAVTTSNVTTAVLPLNFRTSGPPGGLNGRWMTYTERTPTGHTVHLYFSTGGLPSDSISHFVFVDDVTVLTDLGSVAGDGTFAFPVNAAGGGEREFTVGEPHVELLDVEKIVGGMRISFKATVPGGGNLSIAGYHTSGDNPVPNSEMTWSNPSVGSMNGNIIENVPGNDATQTVDWDAETDGFTTGDQPRVQLRAFV